MVKAKSNLLIMNHAPLLAVFYEESSAPTLSVGVIAPEETHRGTAAADCCRSGERL